MPYIGPNTDERTCFTETLELGLTFVQANLGGFGRKMTKAFESVAAPIMPENRVIECLNSGYGRSEADTVIYEGGASEVSEAWQHLLDIGKGYDERRIIYDRYGVNCQVVMRHILSDSDLVDPSSIKLKFADYGWSNGCEL